MRDALLKIRILAEQMASTFDHWKREVWQRDLDERHCCDGHMCGCHAVTIRELYRLEKAATQPEAGE